MSRILKTAAIVVGAVALVATGIGAIAAAGTALALTAATIGTIAGVASAVLSVGASLTAKKPSAQATGSQTEFSADPDAGIPLAIGRTGTAGNITARIGFDTADKGDNDRQAFVATLSLGPIAAVEKMTVDRVATSFSPSGAAIGAFAGFMWSMTQLGGIPEASALSFGAGAGTPPGWTSQHKLSGKAAATWTLRFDTNAKLYQNGVPAPMWTVRGAKCYDPTKDSTYPGGSGSHRMADPAATAAYDAAMDTWEWSENPYLLGLRWAHGFWQRDRSNPAAKYQRVMGMGANWAAIDVAAFVEGRNIAQVNGWTVGGMIYSGDGKWDTMKKILQAGMGEPLALGARISCMVNAPKVSLATITVDDVVGPASVAATQPRRDRVNTITPRFRLEANNWELLPGAPISVPEYVTEDRGKRSKAQDYPFIQSTAQVATAVRYDIENAREFGPIILPLKLVWMGYKPGDCVTASLPELGLVSQPILLLNRELGAASGVVTMTARSETAQKHPYALGQTATPPPTPGVSGPPLVPVPAIGAWQITATGLFANEAVTPAIVIQGAVDIGTAESIVFEYRPFVSGQAEDAGWASAGVYPPNTVRQEITSVRGGEVYEAAVSYRRRGVTGGRRILGPVTVDGTSLDFDAVTGPTKPEDNATNGAPDGTNVGGIPAENVYDALTELAQTPDAAAIVAGVRDLVDRLRGALTAQLSMMLLSERRADRLNRLTHLDGTPLTTRVKQEVNDRIENDTAIVTMVSEIEATATDGISAANALIQQEAEVRASADAAEATQRDTLIAGVTQLINGEALTRDAAIVIERKVRADADSAEATARETQVASVAALVDGEVFNREAALVIERQVRADADSAEVSAREQGIASVTSLVDGERVIRDAAFVVERQARADGDSAEASAREAGIATVTSLVNGEKLIREAAFVTERQARADGDSAEASTREAQIASVTALVNGERQDRVAAITEERQTSASETGAVAQNLLSLASTVGGHSSSINFLLRAVDGTEAIAQLTVNVDGVVTGFKINGSDRVFAIAADRFIVGNSQIFEVDTVTGIVRIKNAAIGTANIDTLNIAGQAVTKMVAAESTGTLYVPFTSRQSNFTAGKSVVLSNPSGAPVRLDICYEAVPPIVSSDQPIEQPTALVRLVRKQGSSTTAILDWTLLDFRLSRIFLDVPAANVDATYQLHFAIDSSYGGSTSGQQYPVPFQQLFATEVKR